MTEIAPESVVSHYRLLSPLGEGGMGVVYLAEDVTLTRRAALKFLPEKNHTESATLERFLREARAASALNHPNICTIYEFGEHNGRSFLAMELLEGASLDRRLTNQPMPLDRLLDLGIQVADALDAAHRKGIVHRDIKPANLFLTNSGQVKVLDFGLAKLTEVGFPGVTIGASPSDATAANSLTHAGSAVGTVAYMSPEQARGEKLDARTDLFSLGVVLYQLSTGQHPFQGTTTAVIFDKILNHAPVGALELNANLPAEFARILNKALDKDPDLRYQSAADFRADLKRLRRETTSDRALAPAASGSGSGSGAVPASATISGPASSPGSSGAVSSAEVVPAKASGRGKMLAIGAAAVVVLATVALAVWYFMPRTHPFSNVTLRQITQGGDSYRLAMSPDGRTLAEVKIDKGQQSLWIRNIPTNAETQILPPSGADFVGLAFSGDGNNLYFSRTTEESFYIRTLYVVPVFGGTPRALIRDVDSAPSFSPDGERFVYLRQTPELKDHFTEMHVVNKDLSGDEIVSQGANSATGPLWSPDGKKIAWGELANARDTSTVIYDISSKQTRRLPPPGELEFRQWFAWMPDSSGVVTTYATPQSDLVQIGLLDLSSGRLRAITNDLNTYSEIGISADGHSFATVSSTVESELSFYKADGGTAVSTAKLRVSPNALVWQDANHIAFIGHGRIDLYDRSAQTLATLDTGNLIVGNYIAACPNGQLLFTAVPKGIDHPQVFRMNADGSGLTSLTKDGVVRAPYCINGDTVDYTVHAGTSGSGWSVPLAGGTPHQLFAASGDGAAVFSRDGTVAVSRHPGENVHDERILAEIHDLSHPDSQGKVFIMDARWPITAPRISPDGKSLVYAIVEKGLWSLFSQPLDALAGPGRALTEPLPVPIASFSWSPDGSQLVILREQFTANVVLITDQGSQASR